MGVVFLEKRGRVSRDGDQQGGLSEGIVDGWIGDRKGSLIHMETQEVFGFRVSSDSEGAEDDQRRPHQMIL